MFLYEEIQKYNETDIAIYKGSMSIVGVGFYKSRSILAFKGIFMFFMQRHIFLHGKQTSKHPHGF